MSERSGRVILVHRPDGGALLVNADLIEQIEVGPPPVVALVDGRRIPVTDHPDDLVERITRFRASVLVAADEHRVAPSVALRLAPEP